MTNPELEQPIILALAKRIDIAIMNPELQRTDDEITKVTTDIESGERGISVLKDHLKTLLKKRKQLVKLYEKIEKVANGDKADTQTLAEE